MKASFPHLRKKRKKKKAEKIIAPPGFKGTKPGLHSSDEKGIEYRVFCFLFSPCWIWIYQPNIETEAHSCLLQGSSQLRAYEELDPAALEISSNALISVARLDP